MIGGCDYGTCTERASYIVARVERWGSHILETPVLGPMCAEHCEGFPQRSRLLRGVYNPLKGPNGLLVVDWLREWLRPGSIRAIHSSIEQSADAHAGGLRPREHFFSTIQARRVARGDLESMKASRIHSGECDRGCGKPIEFRSVGQSVVTLDGSLSFVEDWLCRECAVAVAVIGPLLRCAWAPGAGVSGRYVISWPVKASIISVDYSYERKGSFIFEPTRWSQPMPGETLFADAPRALRADETSIGLSITWKDGFELAEESAIFVRAKQLGSGSSAFALVEDRVHAPEPPPTLPPANPEEEIARLGASLEGILGSRIGKIES